MPVMHALELPEHELPSAHDTQLPALQKPPLHSVPCARFGPSTQTGPPLAHEMTPCSHALGLPEQPAPALHDTQPPAPLHTRSVPHEMPAPMFVVVSTHAGVPPE